MSTDLITEGAGSRRILKDDLPTPALLVDLDLLEDNLSGARSISHLSPALSYLRR